MPQAVVDVVLTAVTVLLLGNFMVALVVFARRHAAGSWLLVILLGSTTGAALAAVLSLVLTPPGGSPQFSAWPRRVVSAAILAVWFLWQSLRGGVDVAARAVRRPAGIEPAVIEAGFDLAPGHARQLAMTMMNLMPGSMVQRVVAASGRTADETVEGPVEEPSHVELHTLSAALDPADQWSQLQHRVGRAFTGYTPG